MVTRALRAPPVLRSAARSTVPAPLPVGVNTRTHASLVAAVHAHTLVVATLTEALPPVASRWTLVLLSSYWQGAASCEMVTRWSLIKTAAVRGLGCPLTAAESVNDPSPWPEVGDTCSHDASLDAVQLHSRAAVTGTFTRPPAAGIGGTDEPREV
jgi:hypothetical protein